VTVINSTGDGVLAEFPSALDAVEWALAINSEVMRLVSGSAEPPITFRIAVHLGDVIPADNDIYGDGVNVAARLLRYANPGGIVMSEAVYDLVRGSVSDNVRDLGYLQLKNFEKPIKAYALEFDVPQGISVPARAVDDLLPSIAVLPFQNLTNNQQDDYLGDGVVEDIIVSLSGLHELMVISRGSTLRYRGQSPDPREIGRALGVRYVLLGSIRRLGGPVRVAAQLSDAVTGANLWGERADVESGDLFDVQDRIVGRVVGGIAPHVRAAELRRSLRKRPGNFTAYDYWLKALDMMSSLDKARFQQAREFLDMAMVADPGFAMPAAWGARWHSLWIGQGWSTDRQKDAAAAIDLATRAINLDRYNPMALATMGHLKSYLSHEYDTALLYFDRALSACPNSSLAWILSSATLAYVGRGDDAVKHAEQGLRLSPCDRDLFHYYGCMALAHYANGDFEEVVKWARMSESENAAYTANLRYMIGAFVALGRLAEAREAVERLLRHEPDFHFRRNYPWSAFRDPEVNRTHTERLRIAGLPD
jgi:adenylate cyclase